MTHQEKNILKMLLWVNLLVFCCGLPVLALALNVGNVQSQLLALIPPTGTPRVPLTPTRPLPTATIENNWKLYPVASDGYAMALPNSWVYQELNAATIDQAIAELKKKNSQLADIMQKQGKQLLASGIKFYAIDGTPGSAIGGSVTNCNIIHQVQPQVFTLDYVLTANLQELENTAAVSKPITHKRVQLGAGEAEEVRYVITMAGANNQAVKFSTIQYLLVRGKDNYIVTFGTPPTLESKNVSAFQKIVQTFRYVP
ncbi:MAG: hypothetical protein HZB51_30615 [Chloroflexi bacterium]|nr:hypothetical protein [Chloroflexota bacterium]